jgi:hypothetical protein
MTINHLDTSLAQALGMALCSYAHWVAIFERLQELKNEDAPPDAHEAAYAEAIATAGPAVAAAFERLTRQP